MYDALTAAGFKVFLDQFHLIDGASLETSLSQAAERPIRVRRRPLEPLPPDDEIV